MIETHIVTTPDDLQAVRTLVQKIYTHQHFGRVAFRADAWVCSVSCDGVICGAVSVVPDGPYGLPMDAIPFRGELAPYRGTWRLAEISQLVMDRGLHVDLWLALCQQVYQHARSLGIDYLGITVHPRHAAAYRRLGFISIDGTKPAPAVNNAPAVAMVLDLAAKPTRLLRRVIAFAGADLKVGL